MSESTGSDVGPVAGPKLQSTQSGPVIRAKFFTTRNLSVAIVGVVLIVAMFRAERSDIPKIVELLVGSRTFGVVGWSIAIVVLIAAVVLVKLMSWIYEKEIQRLVSERDRLQEQCLRKDPKSNE